MRNDVGWWMPFAGPFRYMDLMGVEAYYRVMRDLLPDLSTDPDIPKLMRDVVEGGGRGIKKGAASTSTLRMKQRAGRRNSWTLTTKFAASRISFREAWLEPPQLPGS